MKFFKNFFKKKTDESSLKNNELAKNNALDLKKYTIDGSDEFDSASFIKFLDEQKLKPLGENATDEQLESQYKIYKYSNSMEISAILFETYNLRFHPSVELKNVKSRIGEMYTEHRFLDDLECDFEYVLSSNAKIFIQTFNSDLGKVINGIYMQGSPDEPGQSRNTFKRTHMFKLALEIVGNDKSITIIRDDWEYKRVEFTRDDLKKYISSH